jgi:hypothetical protein
MPYSNRYARSYRTSYAAPSNGAWKLRPASEQQVNFTLRLQNEKECEAFTPAALNQMNQGTISELIDQLKAAPRRAQPAAASVVLDFAPMIRIFRHAAEHLKYPKVRVASTLRAKVLTPTRLTTAASLLTAVTLSAIRRF